MTVLGSQTADLRRLGPVVDVLVFRGDIPPERALEQDLPCVRVPAIIDTGAEVSAMRTGIAGALGLKPIGTVTVATPTLSRFVCPCYRVRVLFPGAVSIRIVITEAPMQGQEIQCLIGRDVLQRGSFVYLGHMNTFSLSL